MDFADRIRELARRAPTQLEHIQTEEATKSALVMPFIAALGYDPFNPAEVVPEYTADVGTKKGEKVDYAIVKEGKPILIFECKKARTDLEHAHASQLYRYFTVTETRFAVLTDGLSYKFYSDLDKPNCMDSKPFLEISLLRLDDTLVDELKKFTKSSFDLDQILESASILKYTREITRLIAEQWRSPSDDFVKLFAAQVYSGQLRKNVLDQFRALTRSAFHAFVNETIKGRLQSAIEQEATPVESVAVVGGAEAADPEGGEIVTTTDELEGFYIVKSILRDVTDARRVVMRDAKAYCAILLDDTNRKPICRLYFNTENKRLGLFDEAKNETRVAIDDLDDIYRYASQLAATVFHYDKGAGAKASGASEASG